MLTIDLARLEREGSLEIQAGIPPDDPSWEGTELRFSAPLSGSGGVQWITSGEVVAHVTLRGSLEQECRRCLEPVDVPMSEDLYLVYAPPREGAEEGDEETRPLPTDSSVLRLGEAIREEVILSQWPFALCRTDCKGICPTCWTNLN